MGSPTEETVEPAALPTAEELALGTTTKSTKLSLDDVIKQMGKNPLPDGYIAVSLGANRKVRRMSTRVGRQNSRHYQVWWRTLTGYGIDPKAVIELRIERKKNPLPATTKRTRPLKSSHNQRRKAAHVRKLVQTVSAA